MISVCMATYNGEKTVARQLHSILKQLTKEDELVIIDDQSKDRTVEIVKETLNQYDIPYSLSINPKNLGPIFSFERALKKAAGDYIYLSDQDDEWFLNKVEKIQHAFKEGAALVVHDAHVVDGELNILDPSWNHYNNNNIQQGISGNLLKNAYTGAMMAFTKEVRDCALPFPKIVEMHDQFLFMAAKKNGLPITIIHEPLMNYVRHGNNVTGMKKRSKKEMIQGRYAMVKCYLGIKKTKGKTRKS